ncbi:EexN family lipoprotein [Enterobacter chengduensis]|uniref:EexN family lipoprotein n=1 Tax=Enterobacter chengduensis TaxID=2494701 RepID=UPI002004C73D|nr:EexN family lipoprotein [Enterobacter chengduensis]MCK6817917.1 EexN family lipoprotein [Enterobacter chengduensis]
MNTFIRTTHTLALASLMSACGPSPANDTVEFLAAHPERIREIQRLCREDRSKVRDELCVRSAEAAKRRFFGDRPEQHTK